MSENNRSWARSILTGVVGCLLVGTLAFPYFARVNYSDGYPRCPSNLKQIGLALRQYSADYGWYLPVTASGGATYGWGDALFPYVKSEMIYQCPEEAGKGQNNPRQTGYIDYLFNTRYAGVRPHKLKMPANIVLLVDGNDGASTTNARYSASVIPPLWRSATSSPLYRHNGGANYLCADGHVQWAKPAVKLKF